MGGDRDEGALNSQSMKFINFFEVLPMEARTEGSARLQLQKLRDWGDRARNISEMRGCK
jgi:hypothetical protein